jgi:hypothetical protein
MSKNDNIRLCITVKHKGVTAYGNKAAFEALAQKLLRIAASLPSEHFECHTVMALQDDASKFEGKKIKNVYSIFDQETAPVFAKRSEDACGFELTFMMAPEHELDQMDTFQEQGMLPDYWD